QEATTVREFLSTTTGRLLGRLTRVRSDLLAAESAPDALAVVLVDLAALAGLSMESTVRGPAWRFLDLARRLERAIAVLGSIQAAAGPAVEQLAFQPLAESLLQVNESLVAYRRRYRSDVELGAVLDLLVHDDANPRSLAFQLDRLREHVASLAWQEGADLVHQASLGMLTHVDDTVAGGRRLGVDALVLAARGPLLELGNAVVRRWFADPVNPMVMGSS
ncbi:MAG: alpha-E domain-containing protein, partial [Actinomycetes bacterium]